jgi:hypothetical protein
MKSLQTPILVLVVVICFCFASCTKHNSTPTPTNPIDQLPPATQTGANTFGCLVNGQAFLPGNTGFAIAPIQANYEYLNGSYSLRVVGTYGVDNDISSVGIFTDSLSVTPGDSIMFSSDTLYSQGLAYALTSNANNQYYHTKLPMYTGLLYISHLDSINQIVSGTFWFNAINQDGDTSDTVSITNGRFDVHYAR